MTDDAKTRGRRRTVAIAGQVTGGRRRAVCLAKRAGESTLVSADHRRVVKRARLRLHERNLSRALRWGLTACYSGLIAPAKGRDKTRRPPSLQPSARRMPQLRSTRTGL